MAHIEANAAAVTESRVEAPFTELKARTRPAAVVKPERCLYRAPSEHEGERKPGGSQKGHGWQAFFSRDNNGEPG